MAHADFVHLRVHTAYSLSEGAVKIKDLAAMCQRHAMPAVAITDSGNLFGALEFAMTCADAGVQPIIGCQLAIRRPGSTSELAARNGQNGARAPSPDALVLLAQNETGYRNLIKLVSRSYLDSDAVTAPQLGIADLEGQTEGLIALTGGPAGAVGRLLSEDQWAAAEAVLTDLSVLFKDRLYVELSRHGLEVERVIEPMMIELADKHELPLVATNEAYFSDEGMYEAHDALLCIAEGTFVAEPERRRLTPSYRFKSAEEMRALFVDLPEAVENTLVIARRCAYMPEPREPILPAYPAPPGRDEASELRQQAADGLERRLERHVFQRDMDAAARDNAAEPYRERLDFELGVIIEMGFPGYFLIVADFIQWARRQGIPVGPGRGSGAGSVVAWALTITDLDPLRFGLLFERFLNPDRVSMPDFDIDFCQERRDEVIQYVQQKYGRDRVAQIITFGTLQARAALRDVGRVLQMPYGQVDRICKLVPYNPANPVSLQKAIDGEPTVQQMRDSDETVKRLIDVATKLEGLYRHASTHAAGVVIGDRALIELIPLYRDPRSDMPVTQFSMKYIEAAGLVKFDFLGLKTLTVLAHATELLGRRGVEIDLSSLPLDDRRTYDMLGRAEVTGVFQLESSGMRDVLRRLRPDRFEDIIALVALYRPGPMDNIPRYIAARLGEEPPDYLHPTLEETLKETAGVIVYQEQVMQIAQVLSGYTLGSADILRHAMGKKIKSEMAAQRKNFVEGAIQRGVPEGKATLIFDQVDKFAGYGFNKSHAAAYAMVAYQTAYLKANHPVEFLAASMTLDMSNTDRLSVFRQDLDRMGIRLLPPDVNRSDANFTVNSQPGNGSGAGAIRYALAAIKNVGRAAMEALVRERSEGGQFRDLFDFAQRMDNRALNKRQLENLIFGGAFDSLNPNRAQVFKAVESVLRSSNQATADRESNQQNLFGTEDCSAGAAFALTEVADWPPLERLQREFEAMGFYLSAHPLDGYGGILKRLNVVPSARLAGRLAGDGSQRVNLAGTVLGRQERTSARGNRFAFVQLSDTSGAFEVTLFSETLAASRELLDTGAPILISGDARLEEDAVRITAQSIQVLDQAAAEAAMGLTVYLRDDEPLQSLRAVIDQQGRGRGKVRLIMPIGSNREVEIALPGVYAISPSTRAAVRAIPGVVDAQEM